MVVIMMPLLKKQPDYIIVDGNRLPLIATRHRRSKRLILRFDAKSQSVKLTLPRGVSIAIAMGFVESRKGWLAKQIAEHTHVALDNGVMLSLWGEQVTITHTGGRGVVRLESGQLRVPGDAEFIARRVRDFIQKETKARITTLAHASAQKLDVTIRSIQLRNTTSRWGSCSASGALSFCWRLAFAPKEVMDYVVHHEVAHLKHHNHSVRFWKTVELLCPDYERHERWLNKYGQTLWSYD